MKKTTYLAFILYFIILVLLGGFFYFKFLKNYTGVKTAPIQVEIINAKNSIYYTKQSNLYQVDSENPQKINTFTSNGEIGQLDIDKSKSSIVYEMKNSAADWEVWQGDFNEFQKEKIAAKDISTFESFQSFTKPKYSPDKSKLAILAEGDLFDAVFVKNLQTNAWQSATGQIKTKIIDYSWSENSKKLIFCTSQNASSDKNTCYLAQDNSEPEKSFEAQVKQIVWDRTDNPYYLSSTPTPHIYMVNLESKDTTQIDDLLSPKIITGFQINYQGKKIAYTVVSGSSTDVYLSNIDGTNRLQLTNDGQSQMPIFSPLEEKLAILKQKNGIYTISIDESGEQKIVNLTDTINLLALWR